MTTRVVAVASNGRAACATPFRYGVTTYPVIGLPLAAGAVQLTVAAETPAAAVGAAGAAGDAV